MSIVNIDKPTLEFLIKEISHFSAIIVSDGKSDTEEDRIINSYAEGAVLGYNDAVKQIIDMLKDLRGFK